MFAHPPKIGGLLMDLKWPCGSYHALQSHSSASRPLSTVPILNLAYMHSLSYSFIFLFLEIQS